MGVNRIEYIRLLCCCNVPSFPPLPFPPSVIPGTVAVSEDMLSWMAASVMAWPGWTHSGRRREKRNFPENGTEREKQMGDDDGRGALALGRLLKTGNCQCEIIIPPAKPRNCDSRNNVFFLFLLDSFDCTVWMEWLSHRKWRETEQ